MKCQSLFSGTKIRKYFKMCLLIVFFFFTKHAKSLASRFSWSEALVEIKLFFFYHLLFIICENNHTCLIINVVYNIFLSVFIH